MGNNSFGIDLGTSNIKIYSRNDDTVTIEKNMIAIENKNTLFAYGNSAFEMHEKAPGNIHISYGCADSLSWCTVSARSEERRVGKECRL